MTDKTPSQSSTRREFFKTAGLGSAAAAVTAVGIAPTAPAEATEAKPEAQGYRETAHVKRYYELAKF
jgi:hypothetical protein